MTDPTTTDGDVYVFPRYLAGLGGIGDPSFEPVAHWPHHHMDGHCQLLITSPDHRIKIGWFGDDFDVWRISAAENAVSAARWTASFNDNMPPEIVRGLTTALAGEWDEDSDTFLNSRSYRWTDAVQPLLDASWKRKPLARGKVEIVSPDQLAGASIDVVSADPDAELVTLWAGPPGWGTRAEAHFTARTPEHLIAATAAAFVDPTPIARYKDNLNPRLAKLAQLSPVQASKPAAPTPLDIQRARAAHRAPALGTRSVPRWSTTTLPPALPAGRSGPRR
ncbi:DUF317 domain-containing protein [Streptomyces chattanoogensis]|uniref:DUF317 domain-containing protein n=1 Tax=Streptomyces chattanoogensis TaxID=66876 RepID=A0A0N1JXQ6_9ACTN|nr:DUF317 domain-containing protein [Streptomyces chattanoogensis]KPC62633.1 hypothetical protein ADL29_17935 [Streptomyces chattanoogensis]